jgi:hypothetical protein
MTRLTDLRNCSGCGARFRGGAIYGGPELHGHAFCNGACKFSYVIQELTKTRDALAKEKEYHETTEKALDAALRKLQRDRAKLDALPDLHEAALLAERFLREHPLAGPGIATVAQALREAITRVEMALAGHPNTPPDSVDRAEAELASRPGWGGDS